MIRSLVWKAWLETKARFLAAAIILGILGVSTVLRAKPTIAGWESVHVNETMSYPLYIWLSLSHGFLQFLWIIAAVLLGLGGLLRERSAGTSAFSLSLPVKRSTHMLTRAALGAVEAMTLGFIPGVIVSMLSPITGFSYPLSQSLIFGFLLVASGLVFYALGFLLSHLLAGEYSAPGVALALIAAYYIITKIPRFSSFNVFDAMDGKLNLVGQTFYMGSSYPAATIAGSLLSAVTLVGASIWRMKRSDLA